MDRISRPTVPIWRPGPTLSRYLQAFVSVKGLAALAVIVLLTAAALLAPWIFPAGYDAQSSATLEAPSFAHPFGTDELGRDIFIRTIYGLRADLGLVYLAVPISMIAGTLLGLSGVLSPWFGSFVQRCLDIIVGFPGIILAICVVLIMGVGWTALLVSIVIQGLPPFGRLARSVLLAQQQAEYVVAARTLGVGNWPIMIRHILPNALDPIFVQATVFVVTAIFTESALSIVGLGLQPPEPSLGTLLNVGMRYIMRAPSYVMGPMIMLILIALAFSLLSDALNETVNRK